MSLASARVRLCVGLLAASAVVSPTASASAGDPAPVASTASTAVEARPPSSPAEATTTEAPPSTTRTAGFVLAGLGFVGIGIGTYFAISAAAEAGSVASEPRLCSGGVCTEAGRSALAELRTQRTIASLLVGGGMVGLASGAILLSLDDDPRGPELAVGAAVGEDGAGLSVGLSF